MRVIERASLLQLLEGGLVRGHLLHHLGVGALQQLLLQLEPLNLLLHLRLLLEQLRDEAMRGREVRQRQLRRGSGRCTPAAGAALAITAGEGRRRIQLGEVRGGATRAVDGPVSGPLVARRGREAC